MMSVDGIESRDELFGGAFVRLYVRDEGGDLY